MSNSDIAGLEAEIKEYRLQLEQVALALQNDPENDELQSLKGELEEAITLSEAAIIELKPPSIPVTEETRPSTQPAKEKWSRENHPAYQAGYRKAEVEPEESTVPTVFSVNDTVRARWKTGDGEFYNARITSITGSASNPVYIVTFKSYGTTETLSARDLRPISVEAKKRKADGISGSSTPVPPPPPSNPNVISAAASVDPALAQQARGEPSKVSDGPVRPAKIPRQVKAKKELEAGQNKWQDFQKNKKFGKSNKKESMFRIGDSVNARVGFTGSGQQMRKDPARTRHIYQQDQTNE